MGNIPTYVCVHIYSRSVYAYSICMHVCMYKDCVYSMYCILSYTSTVYMDVLQYLQYVQCVPFQITLQLLINLVASYHIAELKRNLQTERDHVKSLTEEKEQLVCKPTILCTVCMYVVATYLLYNIQF